MPLRVSSFTRAGFVMEKPWRSVELDAQERHLRRKLLTLKPDEEVLVDFVSAVKLEHRDCLVLEDGRLIEILAAAEDLLEVTAADQEHLIRLAWHIGNRHLEAQIDGDRILIRPDHVIAHMLEHQGAKIRPVREPFSPEHGAYHGHSHGNQAHEH